MCHRMLHVSCATDVKIMPFSDMKAVVIISTDNVTLTILKESDMNKLNICINVLKNLIGHH